jgi:hypothetical protein
MRYEPQLLVYHERTTRKGRMGRRVPYGYGMGAHCALRLFEGDANAARVFLRWTGSRLARMVKGVRRLDPVIVYEEALVLSGTVRGLVYGYRIRKVPGKAAAAPGV